MAPGICPLRADFEEKQRKAANLQAYEQQFEDMQELLETMFRQLPSKTEMDKLLVDISQSALAAGIDVQLFEPLQEAQQDFYAERPIAIRMLATTTNSAILSIPSPLCREWSFSPCTTFRCVARMTSKVAA
jgi:Tfp pilus assembly protein PilO